MATFRPPAGYAGPTWTTAQVQSAIASVAAQDQVPVALAEAIAQQESGDNPYAIGDKGSSFGVFQLHHGGELDSLPGNYGQQILEAFDPTTNAKVALSRVAAVYQADPNRDPGQIAAAAQRPADQAAYARAIDNILGTSATSTGGAGAFTSSGGSVQTVAKTSGDPGPFGSGTTTYKLTPLGPGITIWSWPRIGFVLLGGLLVLLGIYITFIHGGGSSTGPVKIDVDETAATDDKGATTTTRTRNAKIGRHTARRTTTAKRAAPAAPAAAEDAAAAGA